MTEKMTEYKVSASNAGIRVYLAHSISTRGEFEDSKRVADELRALGYDVYAAAENLSINDKANEPTPSDIYVGDVSEILKCDIFVVCLSGGHQDGTISEVGLVAGLNESYYRHDVVTTPIVAYSSNLRLNQPQFYEGIPSASANHLVLGMIDVWGAFYGDEAGMLEAMAKGGDSLLR